MTPSFFGTSGMASAPVLLRISFSSNSAPGSGRGLEPVARMTFFAVMVSPPTTISFGDLPKAPRP